jgi:hypothetical protein
MDYADAIRRQAEDAPRAALPAVTAALWRAFGDGHVTEAEAEALSLLIEARTTVTVSSGQSAVGQASNATRTASAVISDIPSDRQRSSRTGFGSRPRTDASLERRRRWAASGRLPPAIAAKFTSSEQAALSLVAAETARRGDCRLSVPHMAALVGVAETTVRNAVREARQLGLLTVEERRVTGFRSDTNVVRIISSEWVAWLRLARKEEPSRYPPSSKGAADRDTLQGKRGQHGPTFGEGGGCKFANRTSTQVSKSRKTRALAPDLRRSARRGSPS